MVMTRSAETRTDRGSSLHDFRRRWLVPMIFLTATALVLFFGFYSLDHVLSGGRLGNGIGPLERYGEFDPASITDAVSSLAGMIAAVFGIVITVVSIVVQLSANRYTGVARMFLRDRLNIAVMGYYVVTCVCGVWLSVSIKTNFVPHVALTAMLIATTLGLVVMAPFFGYVFWFLEPQNIVQRIRAEAFRAVREGAFGADPNPTLDAQMRVVTAMEELTDVTSNSISSKDKIIAGFAVDAVKDFILDYLEQKAKTSERWLAIGAKIRANPDFIAMDPESLVDLEHRRTWVEWKAMRQYLGIYNESLESMRDINYLIAIDTRYIGEAAGRLGDMDLVRLVFRFMNSYIRATLNSRDVRTAYNVLNQYRLLVEAMIRQGHESIVIEAIGFLNYYGHVSFDMKLTFVTETIAYDFSSLCQVANEQKVGYEHRLLESFLQLDRPLRSESQEQALLGVRKAQSKLAAYYLTVDEEAKARLICEDMRHEPYGRLQAIRAALEGVTAKDFWEIIDRGRNFEYMPEPQRARLVEFFGWLGVQPQEQQEPVPPSSVAISSSS